MEGSVALRRNELLALLPQPALDEVASKLEFFHYPAGGVVHDSGPPLEYCVFPVSGLVGRLAMTADGKSTGHSMVGCDGMIGASLALGGRPMCTVSLVIDAADTFRVRKALFLALLDRLPPLRRLVLRYAHTLLQEAIQIALCNRHHDIEQQLSRWLLMALDRTQRPSVAVTQALISQLLGVRREGVTEAAGKLYAEGIIDRRRGRFAVVDRQKLETRCCECYRAIDSYHRALRVDLLKGEDRSCSPWMQVKAGVR